MMLRTDMRHVHFDVQDEAGGQLNGLVLALGPFRRIMRDYGQVCRHIMMPFILNP